ncbi:unnamed protein product, partial [Rotaria magnacalcarata]
MYFLIIQDPWQIYFVGSKDKSRQIVTHHNRINEDNLDSHVLDIWSAQD